MNERLWTPEKEAEVLRILMREWRFSSIFGNMTPEYGPTDEVRIGYHKDGSLWASYRMLPDEEPLALPPALDEATEP